MANFCWSFASLLMALTTLVALVAFMKEPDVFRGPGHHDHRPSRDQLASAASTTSVVRKLLPLYQQELLLDSSSSSSIAAALQLIR
ncbi:unnamed protein product [Sphagnum jensenii]|uniref:Uncharacterized protein n=1 Tax=Sphagnum jensenii TaxID=128206 RepID=A0ABP0VV32_9BRYO